MAGIDVCRAGRMVTAALGVTVLLACLVTFRAAEPDTENVSLRIGLPPGGLPTSFILGDGGVVLDLPADAAFPADLEGATGGLLSSSRVDRAEGGRIRLELMLASGYLQRVDVRPDAVVLSFARRAARLTTANKPDGDDAYRLGIDDKVQISVVGHPELIQVGVVSPSGTVSAPLVGSVHAEGQTVSELEARVTDLLSRDYLVDPRVDVQVVEYRSQWVVVSGEVKNPGKIPLRGGMALKEVLAEAGGLGAESGQFVEIARKKTDGTVSTETIDRTGLERGEVDPKLAHGDVINVPKAQYAFVNGEVRIPGKIRIETGMSLLKALSLSGGLTEWANAKAIRVLPADNAGSGQEYNLRDIESGKVPDPPLRGGEIVIVRRRFL